SCGRDDDARRDRGGRWAGGQHLCALSRPRRREGRAGRSRGVPAGEAVRRLDLRADLGRARAHARRLPGRPLALADLPRPLSRPRMPATRPGADGEPELLLHDDLRGYAWNVPKTDWLNVGVGTVNPTEVRAAWTRARDHFRGAGHVPAEAGDALEHVKGHSYYL